jgi:hypothetical protein
MGFHFEIKQLFYAEGLDPTLEREREKMNRRLDTVLSLLITPTTLASSVALRFWVLGRRYDAADINWR